MMIIFYSIKVEFREMWIHVFGKGIFANRTQATEIRTADCEFCSDNVYASSSSLHQFVYPFIIGFM